MSEGIFALRLFARVVLALCIALAISSFLWLEAGRSFPIHGPKLPGFFALSTSHGDNHRMAISTAHSTPTHSGTRRTAPPKPIHLSAATTVLAYPPPPIQARAAILMDMKTGKVLYNLHADARLPIASTTKITTAIVTLGHARLTDLAAASGNAVNVGESTMVLETGERLTVHQLLYGMLLNSANDAAVTLAEHVAGSQPRFVEL